MQATRVPAAFALACLILTALGCAAPPEADTAHTRDNSTSPSPPPNVLLILADDMGYEVLGANGGESYDTPRLDALAAGGLRFAHAHAQPICTPSRVQLMTGIYNNRNYIRFGLLDPDANTLAHLFRDAGYATAIAGKWQLGGESSPRDYIYCWYQRNGVRATASQHARTAHLKLYADGRLFNTYADPNEESPLDTATLNEDDRAAYTMLRDALTHHVAITESCDPIQNEKRGE